MTSHDNSDNSDDDTTINTCLENLDGIYTPIQSLSPLTIFLSNIDSLGPKDPLNDNGEFLLDGLPLARSGLMLRVTAINLIHLYCYIKGLYNKYVIIPNDDMNACFGGDCPAVIYSNINNKGLINIPLKTPANTYDVIQSRYAHFDRKAIKSFFLTNLITLNIKKVALETLSEETKVQLRKEVELIKTVNEVYRKMK